MMLLVLVLPSSRVVYGGRLSLVTTTTSIEYAVSLKALSRAIVHFGQQSRFRAEFRVDRDE